VEAFLGHVILALFVATVVIRQRVHSYARVAIWPKEYEDQVLKGRGKPVLYDDWEGPKTEKENK